MSGKQKAAITIAVGGVLASGAYVLNMLFTEGTSFPEHSPRYWVTISSDTIRSFPVLEPAADPIYYYSSADGPSPALQEVSYRSRTNPAELSERIRKFMQQQGYRREGGRYYKSRDEVTVSLNASTDGLTDVRAYLITSDAEVY